MKEQHNLILTLDQQEFCDQCTRFVKENLHGATMEVKLNDKGVRGYRYSDFVVTVCADKTKDYFEVTRNRDGMLVLAVYNRVPVSINWEFIFVQEHIKSLLAPLPDEGKCALAEVKGDLTVA